MSSFFDPNTRPMERRLSQLFEEDADANNNANSSASDVEDIDVEKTLTELEPVIACVLRNDWDTVNRLLKRNSRCYIHLLGLSLLRGAIAGVTMDKSLFKSALSTAWSGLELAKKRRKKDTGLFFSTHPDCFTDEECMAELMYSEYNAVYGIINVIDDQSFMGFIKGAYRVRIWFTSLKECERIWNRKTNWKNNYIKREFECGVLLALGLFELAISFMPRKFVMLLEMAGYTSNRYYGLQQIEKASAIEESKFHRLACMSTNVLYYLFLENFYGLGEIKRDLLVENIQFGRNLARESHYLALGDGLLQLVEGDFDMAGENLTKMIDLPENPRALRYALCWLQSWICVIKNDWQSALYHADILAGECSWSRALFSYMQGIFIFMLMQKQSAPTPSNLILRDKMLKSLQNVPKLKRNFGGKKAFHEKLVIERSKQFIEDPDTILMPHLDLMYLWNLMSIAKTNPVYLRQISSDISDTYVKMKEEDSLDPDSKNYLIFMQGVTKSLLGEEIEAYEAFINVIQAAGDLRREAHLAPQACLELGLMYRRKKDNDTAIRWLKKTNKFSGYLTESMIRFRADCALKSIADSN